jgi:sRNA-binding regulator protein Hfq
VIVRFVDGSSLEGVVTKYTAYWLEVKLNDGRVVYVNKGAIKMIEVAEEKEGKNQAGGLTNENNKPRQK